MGIFDQISQVLGMQGSQDAAQPALQDMRQSPVLDPMTLPSWAPQGQFDPGQVQQLQQAPEAPTAGILNGGMDESKQQRLLLMSAALMSPGTLADKLRMATLSQAAYTELQGAAGRDDLYKQSEQERLRLDSESGRTLKGAQTRQVEQATQESAEKAPLEIERIKTDTRKLELEVELADRKYKALQKIDPEGAKQAKLDLDLAEEKLRTQKANTAQANASAGEHSARTKGVNQVNDARAILADPKSAPEQREQAQVVVSGGKSAAGQKKDHLEMIAKMYKQANPGATDQDASQYALEAESGTKGETLRAATALYQNATDAATRKAAEETLIALTRKSAGKSGAAPAGNADKAAWEKARNSVKPGQSYVGPDGKTYIRNK